MKNKIIKRKTCRVSGERLINLFSLGKIHMSDFLPPGTAPKKHNAKLRLCLAPKSGLVQLAQTAPLDEMYRQYWYKSGTNATMTLELKEVAETAQRLMKTGPGDVFVDIGCNDGTLLRFVDKKLVRVGFDPAKNGFAELSRKYANLIIQDFFNYPAYKKSKYGRHKAKIVTSIAMFYDLEDPGKFVQDVYSMMDKNGLWIIQMSYLPLMLQELAFDNVCHEHIEYYSLSSLKHLLDKNNMQVVDCQVNDVNGGSFRIYIMKKDADLTKFATTPYRSVANYRVQSILSHEQKLALNNKKTYLDFYKKSLALRGKVVNFIKKEKKKGKTVWGYGASTKGNTLLQWFGLDNTLIDAIAERSPAKYGLVTVSTNIPIKSEVEMRKAKPDYLLILPWHFINEFRQRESAYLRRGGKFIVPCPEFEIIEK